jgi:EAL and modified HD-GYP domain-containing signal transduction protein
MPDLTKTIYIARQPILDKNNKLAAYELLFRDNSLQKEANVSDDTRATATVMENSADVGLNKLVGTHKAFINCNKDILCSDVVMLLEPKIYVLEVLEDVEIDDEVIERVEFLKETGFAIALDDFIYDPENVDRAAPIMKYVDIIKVDLMLCPKDQWKPCAEFIKSNKKIGLAEKVETHEDFKACKEYGYDLYQGYFFAKPEMITTGTIDSKTMEVLKVLNTLHKGAEIKEVEE